MLPKVPCLLLCIVNTKLRDMYKSLDDLCEDLDCSVFELESYNNTYFAGTYFNNSSLWNYISEDGTLEVEIELTELEVY